MASLKSKAKTITRNALYYGKFNYRITIKAGNIFYVQYCNDLDDYHARIAAEHEDYVRRENELKSDPTKIYYYHSRFYSPGDDNLDLVNYLITLRKKFAKEKTVTIRSEGNTVSVFTNDTAIINRLLKLVPHASVTHVEAAPPGIKYFKRTPPANYRVYMSNNRMPDSFKEEMIAYLERTPDLRPNSGLVRCLTRYRYCHLWNQYYIDYDDERNLLMMKLMFPNAFSKNYKLEKKED